MRWRGHRGRFCTELFLPVGRLEVNLSLLFKRVLLCNSVEVLKAEGKEKGGRERGGEGRGLGHV